MQIEVTAHRAEIKICPDCGVPNRGQYPKGVTQAVQYGSGVKTWAAYFPNQHDLSVERTTQIFEDLVGHKISGHYSGPILPIRRHSNNGLPKR